MTCNNLRGVHAIRGAQMAEALAPADLEHLQNPPLDAKRIRVGNATVFILAV
jgi:hypothetical protein